MDRLIGRLKSSAQSLARSAINSTANELDPVAAARDSGMVVELLAKAVLASKSPALLADNGSDFESLLHLTGNENLAKRPLTGIRTIGGHIACVRVAQILPEFKYSKTDGDAVFLPRHGATHLATATEGEARESVQTMVRLVGPLLVDLGIGGDTFWGPYMGAAAALLDESLSAIKAAVQVKLEAAKATFERRLRGIPMEQREAFKAAISSSLLISSEWEDRYECPACGSEAWRVGPIEVDPDTPPEVEFEHYGPDGDGDYVGRVWQIAWPSTFECNVCGLYLENLEMDEAGIDTDAVPLAEPREMTSREIEAHLGDPYSDSF